MRILHVIDSLSMGGAENVLVELSAGQRKLGNDVTVMPLVCPKETPVRKRIEDKGVVVVPLSECGSVYSLKHIVNLAKRITKFDIIHVHLFPAFYWAFFAKILSRSKVPMIYTEHSTDNKRRKSLILHKVDRVVYQYGYKRIVACAEKVQGTFTMAFPSIHHVCYINNGVDVSVFANATPYSKQELLGVREDCFLVTMVARFMPMKRQDTIVEALRLLPSDVHAVFVGGNKEDKGLIEVRELAKRLGVLARVHFLYVRTDVPRILKSSDVVVLASDYEGLSLSSIEGMAACKPFLASDVNGLRDVIHGAGLLFENKNSKALAELILKLKTDSVFYQEVSNACELRSKAFDVNAMVGGYIKVYQACIDKN